MSEGLEKLKTIRHIHDMECGKDESINKDFDIIEKELKDKEKKDEVLEIIKKLYQRNLLKFCFEDLLYTNFITKEEYDLLKEVML